MLAVSETVPFDVDARDDDGRCTAMVSDWDVIVIRLQCVLRTTVHCPNAESMVSASVKVGVVTDEHGQMHCYIFLSMEGSLTESFVVSQCGWVRGLL